MRKLKLRKETLRELDPARLGKAGGGQIGPWTPVIRTIPVNQCVVTLNGCTSGVECP